MDLRLLLRADLWHPPPIAERLTAPTFQEHLGEAFELALDDGSTLDLKLVSVTPGRAGTADEESRRAPFSVLFRGPAEPVLPQRIYRLENQTLGALELFIVPIGYAEAGLDYEAVFG